jgi:2-polyprenyl-3-methyl-5-hydroxy-6-metoxy-1,4-benzoquinol methylase
LDVGCGRGDFINAFHEIGFNCYAVDIESRHEDINKNIKFKTANLETEKLPFDDNSFDAVFTKSVIEHVYNYNNFIAECKRVLKPSGILIVMTPDWVSCHNTFYDDYTHVKPYTTESLRKLFTAHDLSVLTCRRFIQYPAVWRNPFLKIVCRFLQCFGPVHKTRKSSFIRWSRELILLAVGKKEVL